MKCKIAIATWALSSLGITFALGLPPGAARASTDKLTEQTFMQCFDALFEAEDIPKDRDDQFHHITDAASAGDCFDDFPLTEGGADGVSFVSEPALGGTGWLVELRETEPDHAVGRYVVATGHSRSGWIQEASGLFDISHEEFEATMQRIAALIGEGGLTVSTTLPDGNIVVCTDGPGYETRLVRDGELIWSAGFCSNHPNNEIAKMMRSMMTAEFDRAATSFRGED